MRPVPPIYPWSAFDSVRWLESRTAPIAPRLPERFGLHGATEEMKLRLTSEFDRVMFERVGVLRGEFLAFTHGLLLADRAGALISLNFPHEASATAQIPYEYANMGDNWDFLEGARRDWDSIPLLENGTIFSHIYHTNYYHFCFEFLQKFRLIAPFDVKHVLLPTPILGAPAFRELISRALDGRDIVPADRPYRLRDPVIVQTYQSDEGLRWLRGLVGQSVTPAGQKYYVTREANATRSNNNIAETQDFSSLLDWHGFKRISFGNGELSVAEQVQRMAGASVILSPHGAGLTNLAYLNAPARVIEVFGRKVISTSFIRISEALGLEHHAVISEEMDPKGDILVDCKLLDQLISAPLG